MTADVHGKFVWHDLVTTDPAAAASFYDKVLGWRAAPWEVDPSYLMLSGAHGRAAGIAKLPPDMQASGAAPHWLSHVGVSDLQAALDTAQRLGGRVLKAITAIGEYGHYAIVADPHGAAFGVVTPRSSDAGGQMQSEFSWHELASPDHKATLRFYHELLGWEQIRVHDMGAMGEYLLFGRNGQEMGGMFTRSAGGGGPASHWLAYVRVGSASGAAEAAKAAGGRIVSGPVVVPGGSWVAQLLDPQGAAIAVHEPQSAAAQSAPKRRAPAAAKPSAAASTSAAGSSRARAAPHAKRPARKAATRRATAKRPPAKAAKRGAARKTSARRTPARSGAKRVAAKRATARGAAKKKTPARKSAKPSSRSAPRRAARGARRHR